MGLIALAAKAAGSALGLGAVSSVAGALGGTFADQWKEFFYCDAMDADTLIVKGQKRNGKRSVNTKGTDNIITKGSVIAVAGGQCMIIVDNGKVSELCAEPGEFVYDSSTEPSIFAGKLGSSILDTFKEIGRRFTFGGEPPKDQRVYYVNTKEIIGNKYGTAAPIPFRVVDQRANFDIDIRIKCFGEYSFRIADPIRFYTAISGNVTESYRRDAMESQMRSELLDALQPAFAKISAMGIRYSALPGHTRELSSFLNEELTNTWRRLRGLEIVSFGISSITANEEDEKMMRDAQLNVTYASDPRKLAAFMGMAQADAMKTAAGNANGATTGFMGMGMAGMVGGMGGMNAKDMFAMGQQMDAQAAQQNAQAAQAQPAAPNAGANTWKCPKCGSQAEGKFCPECGMAKPAATNAVGWTCSCGAVNKGKFCSECGKPKPAGAPLFRCDKCGWEPSDPHNPPKFCPECGDPFDTGDIVG